MPPRFHKNELSASHAIRRLLDLGITDSRDILMAFELGRTHDNYNALVKFFAAFKTKIPLAFPWNAKVSANLVRVVRQRWAEGYAPKKPRRQRGLDPLPPRKKSKRPKKTSSKSATIRQLLAAGRSTAEICDALKVKPALVRVVRHRIK